MTSGSEGSYPATTCRSLLAIGGAGLAVAALLAVVGSGPLEAQARWMDSPEVQRLYQLAKAEGRVVLWGSQNREIDWIPERFNARFPGIEVQWTADRAAGTKIVAEQRARRYAVDVFHFSLGGMLPLKQRRILGENDWALWGNAPSDILLDGAAGATHNLAYALVYNDELVEASDLPDSWQALLEPRWKGKLVASQFLLPRLLGFLALEWGESRTAAFARALIDDQGTLITRAPREGILQRGERLIAVGEFIGSALYWKSQGLPIGWVALPLVPAAQFAVAPLARAPHPNAAKLLAGWMTTDEAKAARERVRFNADIRPGATSALAKTLAAQGRTVLYEDVDNMVARAEFYERLSRIVTGQVR